MNEAHPVIVIGGSGYVAGEILRLVAGHSLLQLTASVSSSLAGQPVAGAFPHLGPAVGSATFVALEEASDRLGDAAHWVVLSAAPHTASARSISTLLEAAGKKDVRMTIVDASADFRFRNAAQFAAIYGQEHPRPTLLGEFTCAVPEHVGGAPTPHAAQPGCFATTMLLAIVPLLEAELCEPRFHVSAVTGSTGAGRKVRETTHHPERHSNLFSYMALAHRHEPEVRALTLAATGIEPQLDFVPHCGPFARGIHATIFAKLKRPADTATILEALQDFYRDAPFVRVGAEPPRVKEVACSNYAKLNATVRDETVVVCAVLDNLVKGAAGGAVQWANRLLGLPETMGLIEPAPGWL
jgi:N-acetyl-gamma-glutamyl-phosphate reductase common form